MSGNIPGNNALCGGLVIFEEPADVGNKVGLRIVGVGIVLGDGITGSWAWWMIRLLGV